MKHEFMKETSLKGITMIEIDEPEDLRAWILRVHRWEDIEKAYSHLETKNDSADCILVGRYTEDLVTTNYLFQLVLRPQWRITGNGFLLFPFGVNQKELANEFVRILAGKIAALIHRDEL